MSRFARCNKVLYVEPSIDLRSFRQALRQTTFKWTDLWRDLKQNPVRQVRDNLYIFHSPIPISGRRPFDRMTRFIWKRHLASAMRKLGFHPPIVWLSRPNMVSLTTGFGATLVIYHVVDEYQAYLGEDREARRQQQVLEQRLLKSVGLVIVVSEKLLTAKRAFNEHTYLVPNGVDAQAYMQALHSHAPLPPDIAGLPKPVIGYSGLIAARLNLDWLHHLAIRRPDWSIALVGAVDDRRCADELVQLRQLKNVYFLGRKTIDQVPHYVRAFDVCLIPYRVDERAQHASPLKLYDYLATGKPIVTTDFAAAGQFKECVRIAGTQEEFVRQIAEALSEHDADLFRARQRIAVENTWDVRVEQLSAILQSRLAVG